MSTLAHQKYTLSDGSFREIKHNTVHWNLFLTALWCNGYVSWLWRAGRCRRSRRGFEPHSKWYFIFLPIDFFSEVLVSVMILGRNSSLKFVLILNYNNISKLQYPVDPESSLYIMSTLAHQKYTLSDGSFREIKHNTVPWNLFLASVVVQWLCLLTLKG